ncbi:hypothetical protein [Nonomuraea jiangxiensis]|uniref:Uncharacterized protein n=1 Tax=Nonomuraea jiangxiensis TaxID=633440 RepID=A0A1G8RXG3_9ACTN|nr:hypothetical protein [Nonomuraea jiangxiensis]SDJ21110.1 hypothetical protein SAMN05421869_109201 [Nonomuraea jiangxiensis]
MDHGRADGHATGSMSRSGSAGVPAHQATVRRSNLAHVLRHVSARSPCARSAIAVATGLRLADRLIPAARQELARLGMNGAVERCRSAASDLGFGAAAGVIEGTPMGLIAAPT